MLIQRRTPCRLAFFLTLMLASYACVADSYASALSSNAQVKAISGGSGGSRVTVRTRSELEYQLCHQHNANNVCMDSEPRIIEVIGDIDFTNSEGQETSTGCYYDPKNPQKALLTKADPEHACVGNGNVKQPISFDKAGTHPLLVGSNKTIVGHDTSAKLTGKGLLLKHVENVIVQNLTIEGINPAVVWAGDALDLSDVKRVLIDHNLFKMIGRQMIVGHFGEQDNIIVSNNIFDGATPYYKEGHYWNVLFIGTSSTKVTISSNWFRNFSGRAPALHGQGSFVIVNNLYQNGAGNALELNDNVDVLLEGNVFENVHQPIARKSGLIFALTQRDVTGDNSCNTRLGRPCEANQVNGSKPAQGFERMQEALGGFSDWKIGNPRHVDAVADNVRTTAGPR